MFRVALGRLLDDMNRRYGWSKWLIIIIAIGGLVYSFMGGDNLFLGAYALLNMTIYMSAPKLCYVLPVTDRQIKEMYTWLIVIWNGTILLISGAIIGILSLFGGEWKREGFVVVLLVMVCRVIAVLYEMKQYRPNESGLTGGKLICVTVGIIIYAVLVACTLIQVIYDLRRFLIVISISVVVPLTIYIIREFRFVGFYDYTTNEASLF